MRIWVDADACPNVIKDILFRAAVRAQVTLTLVANQAAKVPRPRHSSRPFRCRPASMQPTTGLSNWLKPVTW